MTTFKQAMNSFKSYSDKAQSTDFEKISVSRVSRLLLIMERIAKHFSDV